MTLKITLRDGDDAGSEHVFGPEREVVFVGRDPDVNDVVLPSDADMVGRQHLGLKLVLGRYRLVVNPQNPVFLDGRQGKEGDVLGEDSHVQVGENGPVLQVTTLRESRVTPTRVVSTSSAAPTDAPRRMTRWTRIRQNVRTNRMLMAITLGALIGVLIIVFVVVQRQQEQREQDKRDLETMRGELLRNFADLERKQADQRKREKQELLQKVNAVVAETDLSARFQQALETNRNSVALLEVTVAVRMDTKSKRKPVTMKTEGTGFLVGDGRYMVTNHHVVNMLHYVTRDEDDAMLRRFCSALDQRFGEKGWGSRVSEILVWLPGQQHDANQALALSRGDVKLVGYARMDEKFKPRWQVGFADETVDLALLEFKKPLGKPLKLRKVATGLKSLDQVVLLGYPLGFHKFLLGENEVGLNPFVGTVRRVAKFVQTTVPTYPGNSGGPLIDKDGYVVGVMTSRLGENLSRCVRIEEVHLLLEKYGVK